jgi:hypothetical protein
MLTQAAIPSLRQPELSEPLMHDLGNRTQQLTPLLFTAGPHTWHSLVNRSLAPAAPLASATEQRTQRHIGSDRR